MKAPKDMGLALLITVPFLLYAVSKLREAKRLREQAAQTQAGAGAG